MNQAIHEAGWSRDPSTQNGAILVNPQGLIIGIGSNNFPYGINENVATRWERPEKYLWIEHAERNAIYHAARQEHTTRNSTLYCPWAACADCARAIVQAGVTTLVRFPASHNDRWNHSIEVGDTLMAEAGVKVVEIDIADFVDVIGDIRLGNLRE